MAASAEKEVELVAELESALVPACLAGDMALVRSLLDAGIPVNGLHSATRESALQAAARRGAVGIARLLLARGADVSIATLSGLRPSALVHPPNRGSRLRELLHTFEEDADTAAAAAAAARGRGQDVPIEGGEGEAGGALPSDGSVDGLDDRRDVRRG